MKTLEIRFKPGPVEPDLLRPPRKTLDLKKRSRLLVSMLVSQQNVFSRADVSPTIQTVDFHTDAERGVELFDDKQTRRSPVCEGNLENMSRETFYNHLNQP